MSLTPHRAGLAVAAFTLLLLLPGLGQGSLFDSDDAIYAQMAREARSAGDVVDSRWCGAVQFEKPPLLTASLAGLTALFGESEAVLRVPGVLAAVVCAAALFWVALGLGAGASQAVLAVVLFATTSLAVLASRRVMTDLPMLAGLLTALAAALHGRAIVAGAGLGVAVLAKGVAAGPLALVVLGVFAVRKQWRSMAIASALATALVAPWAIALTARHGLEAWQGLVGYHVLARAAGHVVPGLSVAQLLEALVGEWVLLLGAAAGVIWGLRTRSVRWLPLVWVAAALVPVLLSSTRLHHYLLPTLPGLALLAAALPPVRLLGLGTAAAGLVALAAGPGTLAFWLEPDFGPATKRAGRTLAAALPEDAEAVAWNVTDQALTWYSGRCVRMVATDPVFNQVQHAVLMNQRAGVVLDVLPPNARWLVASRAGPPPPAEGLWALSFGQLVLLNPAGLGVPATPWPPPLEEAR